MADDTPGTPGTPDTPPAMPLWAKVLIGVAAVLVLGFAALHLIGAGRMGH